MTRSRSGFMFLRGGLVCLLLMGMALFAASARAEGDQPPKLSKAEKAYIQRMIDYGKEEKQYPDKKWMYQGCRLNMNGTWYPFSRFAVSWLGRMVITGDSFIFEKVGEFPYEIIRSEYGPKVPPGGALPGRERHLYKLERSVYLGASWRKENNVYVVIAHPPTSKRSNDPRNWIFRCAPEFAICDELGKAIKIFEDKDGTENTGCSNYTFIPYSDD